MCKAVPIQVSFRGFFMRRVNDPEDFNISRRKYLVRNYEALTLVSSDFYFTGEGGALSISHNSKLNIITLTNENGW